MNMLMRLLICCAALATPLIGAAQSLKQIQQEEALRRAVRTLNDLDASLNRMLDARKAACRMAVGYPPFCDCILGGLPVGWTFDDYIAITTRSKEKNGYGKLTAEYKAAYDAVGPIRDQCVKKINSR